MNRRKFIQIIGLGFIATLSSNLLTACGGSGSSASGSGDDTGSDWESYTVSGSGKTYTVEIDFNHSHSATALSVSTFASASASNSIQGTSLHDHTFSVSSTDVTTLNSVGGTVTIVASVNEGHPHNVRVTRTV